MTWWWRGDTASEVRIELMEARYEEMARERDYWREKAELLLDSTLFRRGEISAHVFSKPPAEKPADDPVSRVFSALARTEIESAKRPAANHA